MKKYITTKEECQKEIDELSKKGYVCPYCGRRLVPIETVDNAGRPTFWPGCFHGRDGFGNFTRGVPKRIFKLARKLVLQGFVYYDTTPLWEYDESKLMLEIWIERQTAGWANLLKWVEYLKKNEPRYKTESEFIKANLRKK